MMSYSRYPTVLLLIGPKPLWARPIRKALSNSFHLYQRSFPDGTFKRFLAQNGLFALGVGLTTWAMGESFWGGMILGEFSLFPIGFFKHFSFSFFHPHQSAHVQKIEVIRACEKGDIETLESLKEVVGKGRWTLSIRAIQKSIQSKAHQSHEHSDLIGLDSWRGISPLGAVEESLSSEKHQTYLWFLKQNLLSHQEQEKYLYEMIQNASLDTLQKYLHMNTHLGQDFEVLHALTKRDFGRRSFDEQEQIQELNQIVNLLYPHYLTLQSLKDYQLGKTFKFDTQYKGSFLQKAFDTWVETILLKQQLQNHLPQIFENNLSIEGKATSKKSRL